MSEFESAPHLGPPLPVNGRFTAALLNPLLPVPAGLTARNQPNPAKRFAVYRNNVMHSLLGALGDTFPVVKELVGHEFFDSMGRRFVSEHPPQSPLMHRFGRRFPDWIARFAPAAPLPYLADVARLEYAHLTSIHAADRDPVGAGPLAAQAAAPERLAGTAFALHDSLAVVRSVHPIVSLWGAHQLEERARDERLAELNLSADESALVFRYRDEGLVLAVRDTEASLLGDLANAVTLGSAMCRNPGADMGAVLALLMRYDLITGLHSPTVDPLSDTETPS